MRIKNSLILLLLFIVGCTAATTTPEQSLSPVCTTKECFISAANNCDASTFTLDGEAGKFKYESSTSCVLTKTLVSVSETPEMRNLLEGKSMTCKYEKGKFDNRLVTSLVFGTENCQGPLKVALTELIAFT